MRPASRDSRADWSAGGASFYHPGNHSVSCADALAGLVLYACLLGALAIVTEQTAPLLVATIREVPTSPPGTELAARREAGC